MMDYNSVFTWIMFLTICLVPICVREFRNSAQLLLAYWFVIVLHQAVAFTNSFLFATISASSDALGMHLAATKIAMSGHFIFLLTNGPSLYRNLLGVFYWIFGPSLILAEQLSILAFSISCVVLVKILGQLELSHYKVPILLAFGALPTMVLLGSLTLREPFQLVFFMLTVYFGLKMHIRGDINRYFFFMIMSSVCMGAFHQALSIYAFLLVILFLLWTYRPVSCLGKVKKLRFMAVLAIPALIIGIYTNVGTSSSLAWFISGNEELLKRAVRYREFAQAGRASYGIEIDFSSTFMTIYSSLMLYIHYLFAPFPWDIINTKDAYASIESLSRLVLVFFAFKSWRNAYGAQRRLLGLMLILFFSMTFLWAIGTTNYGTAIRHNMLTWWILVITGLPLLMETLNRALLGLPIRKH